MSLQVTVWLRRVVGSPLLWVLCLGLGGVSSLQAQEAREQDPVYREHIRLALAAYEGDQLGTARMQFMLAHARYPNARTLRGLGTVELELGELVAAVEHLSLAVTSGELPLEGALRSETEAALHEASALVGRVQVLARPESARVVLDGQPRAMGESLVLLPGTHHLELAAEGHVTQTRQLSVSANQSQLVQLVLEPVAIAPPVLPPPPSAWKPWLVVASGGALVLTGAALLGKGLRDGNSEPETGTSYRAWQSQQDRAPRLVGAGATLLGLGAVGITGGLWWRVRQRHAVEVRAALGPSGLQLHGRF